MHQFGAKFRLANGLKSGKKLGREGSDLCPDEEGIKTKEGTQTFEGQEGPTFALMKKGLRPLCLRFFLDRLGPTFALMKKGLRHIVPTGTITAKKSDLCPDEEGIKTGRPCSPERPQQSDLCPDEEGIKTRLSKASRFIST